MPQILYINSQNSAKDAQVIIEDNYFFMKRIKFFLVLSENALLHVHLRDSSGKESSISPLVVIS